MSLIKFRYLHRRRIVSVVAILTLISTLFSVTAYSFLGFYNGFTNYVGEDKDIIAIYSKTSSTPYSGIISLKVTDLVTAQEGVISTSPEVIAPCTINNQSVFIRGIIPDDLKKLNPLQLQYGQDLNLTDTNSCILGINVANKLDLKTGDNLLVFGIASKRYVELQVKGIFNSETSLNDEALVPIYIAQWLRGLNYNDATLIRAKINPQQTNTNQIYQQIINQTQTDQSTTPTPTPKNQTEKQLEALIPMAARTNLKIGTVGIEQSQQFMQNYLDRYGISKDSLIILSIAVLVLASGTAISAITLFVKQHSSDIGTLRCIGVSSKKIKTDLILRMVTWALIATILGTLISAIFITGFQQLGYLQVISHTINFQLDPIIILANFLLMAALVSLSIGRMELKQ